MQQQFCGICFFGIAAGAQPFQHLLAGDARMLFNVVHNFFHKRRRGVWVHRLGQYGRHIRLARVHLEQV